MTATIYTLPRAIIADIPDGDLLEALGIKIDPEPRVDHCANYRAKRAALNRAAFRVV